MFVSGIVHPGNLTNRFPKNAGLENAISMLYKFRGCRC